VVLLSSSGFAGDSSALYRAKESSLDVYATYAAPEYGINHVFETNIRGGSWGGGLGFNRFFSQKLGMGSDINMTGNGGSFIDSVTVNLLGRLPLGNSGLAPYVLGGGGRAYNPAQWIGQAGVGLELRSTSKMGLFVDGRYIWGETSNTDALQLRGGFRLMF
jgi:hypothetical protein